MRLNTQEGIQGGIIIASLSVPALVVRREHGNVVVLSFNVSHSFILRLNAIRADIQECVSSAWSTVRDCTGENMVCSYVSAPSPPLHSS